MSSTEGQVGQLESKALERKARLAALRAKRQNKSADSNQEAKSEEPEELPK